MDSLRETIEIFFIISIFLGGVGVLIIMNTLDEILREIKER